MIKMKRNKYVNHKGRSRRFTSPEELQQESEEASSSEESSSEDEQPGSSKARGTKPKSSAPAGKMPTSSEESDEESEDDRGANKGVAGLIEIENPNRVVKKATQKVSKLNINEGEPELSRREREQIEKQQARQRYEKLHAEGKTAQAKADLARLALIKQQRAEAAAKREAAMKKKETDEKKASGK